MLNGIFAVFRWILPMRRSNPVQDKTMDEVAHRALRRAHANGCPLPTPAEVAESYRELNIIRAAPLVAAQRKARNAGLA